MNITIKGKELELKYGYRCMLAYEDLTGKTFDPNDKSTTTITDFMYCIIYSCKEERNSHEISKDDFIDWIDDNPDNFYDFSVWLADAINEQAKFYQSKVAKMKETKTSTKKAKN